MGWGSGNGKAEVLNPAAGDPIICGGADEHPFNGKLVLIDVSGLGHKASKHGAAEVVRHGKSEQQQEYVRKRVASVAAEGGTPVLVLDGRAYPPKLQTRSDRRDKQAAARQKAEEAAASGKVAGGGGRVEARGRTTGAVLARAPGRVPAERGALHRLALRGRRTAGVARRGAGRPRHHLGGDQRLGPGRLWRVRRRVRLGHVHALVSARPVMRSLLIG